MNDHEESGGGILEEHTEPVSEKTLARETGLAANPRRRAGLIRGRLANAFKWL